MRLSTAQYCGLSPIPTASIASAGCANMSNSQRRVTTGAGIGAATGAVIREILAAQPVAGSTIVTSETGSAVARRMSHNSRLYA